MLLQRSDRVEMVHILTERPFKKKTMHWLNSGSINKKPFMGLQPQEAHSIGPEKPLTIRHGLVFRCLSGGLRVCFMYLVCRAIIHTITWRGGGGGGGSEMRYISENERYCYAVHCSRRADWDALVQHFAYKGELTSAPWRYTIQLYGLAMSMEESEEQCTVVFA
jgi:hypothetical protein